MSRHQRKRTGRADISALFRTDMRSGVGRRRGAVVSPFPSAPPRTGQASFPASRSPVPDLRSEPQMAARKFWLLAFRLPPFSAAAGPCAPCRVRGRVLVSQERQPLPAEPDLRPFDASGSPRVPLLVSQFGRYAMSDSLRLSYFPRWIFSWHVLQTGICFRLSIRRMR
jgi:hypothetical protein